MTAAKRRAVDHLRRARRLDQVHERIAHELDRSGSPGVPGPGGPGAPDAREGGAERDDVLRLIFMSCHPVLPQAERVALTLRLVGGLTAREIARAFLDGEQAITRRIARAKRTLAQERVPFDVPAGAELADRLASVLGVIYLIFNEGYSATSGDELMRPALCHEALRLGRLLAELVPGEAEVHGLVALMELHASRAAARMGPAGEIVQLHEQDRGRWDPLLIRRGFTALLRARELRAPPGPYVLQAAIAVCHTQARTAHETDWTQIASLYDALVRLLPTPIVRLNRAVAVGMARGPEAGLAIVDELRGDPALRDYHLLPGIRGDLLFKLGRRDEARLEFERAAALATNTAERAFLLRRADDLPAAGGPRSTLGQAVLDFLRRDDLDPETIRSYGQTLRRLRRSLGDELPLTAVTADAVAAVFAAAWGDAAAKTWNRHRSAVRSFGGWAGAGDLAARLDRRPETRAHAPGLDAEGLAALWRRDDLPLRERTLWTLLHESGAPVTAVLALDVDHLDPAARRARAADGGTITWGAGTARLLPILLAGRSRGPVFLSDRRPAPARPPSAADLCPETGRRRLSYPRAEFLFKQATKALDPAGEGYTLGRLRAVQRAVQHAVKSTAIAAPEVR
jgi:predicted RNA polymerase sigma factor